MIVRTASILYLSLSCAGLLCLAYYSARMLRSAGSNTFAFFMMSIFMYTFGYVFELSSDTLDGIYLALRIEYLGAPVIPALWLIFAMEYNGYRLPKRFLYPALFVIPVITAVMLYTTLHHGLHYVSLRVDRSGPFPVASAVKGVWYYIHFAYMMILNLAAAGLFGIEALRTTGYRKRQTATIFFGSLFPCAGVILTMLGIGPYRMDISPFMLSIAAPLFGYAMFRLRMFDIVPIARDRVFKTINISVIVLDKDHRVVDFNDCARGVLPRLTDDALGRTLGDVLPEDHALTDAIARLGDGPQELDFPVAERERWFSVSGTELRSQHGEEIGLIVSLHDITENRMLLKRMERMASIDALTQVYGRRFFMESCLLEIRRALREREPLSFLLVDVDHFKTVNDTHGHPAGDMVLKNTAATLRKGLRTSDVLGRYGGEEFAVVLPNTDQDGAQLLAERLRSGAAAARTVYEDVVIAVSISVGVVTLDLGARPDPADAESLREALIKASDQALYQAKEQGRNRVCAVRLP
ncbi:MAG: histidine kinase N-terminal 7TM domain-containing protein [Desulfovibrionaceae bacterium]